MKQPRYAHHKNAEHNSWTERLRAKAEILEAVLSHSSERIYVYDQSGSCLYVSLSGAQALGLRPNDMIGRKYRELGVSSELMNRLDSDREAVLATGSPLTGRTNFATSEGLQHDYEYVVRPIFAGHDQVQAAVCIARQTGGPESRDSAWLSSEQTEDRLQQRETRERQRCLALAHTAQLAAMNELATELAHAVNQPLTAIANYSTACLCTLAAGQTPQTLVEWLENIKTQSKRASELIQRVRRSVGKQLPAFELIDLAELAKAAINFTEIEARAQRIKIEFSSTSEACLVSVDSSLIEQVFLNLIRNAIEALAGTDHGERRVWVHVERQSDRVLSSVRDNGPGLPGELSKQIFEAFVTSKPNSLGMGLSISRSIVRAYQGEIWVSSSPAEGATFTFTLPSAIEGKT